MKKLSFLLLFIASALFAQAQVDKILGEWNTFDDRTGDMRSLLLILQPI